MTSFHADKCCHLVIAHAGNVRPAPAAHMQQRPPAAGWQLFCLQFLIHSTFVLVSLHSASFFLHLLANYRGPNVLSAAFQSSPNTRACIKFFRGRHNFSPYWNVFRRHILLHHFPLLTYPPSTSGVAISHWHQCREREFFYRTSFVFFL